MDGRGRNYFFLAGHVIGCHEIMKLEKRGGLNVMDDVARWKCFQELFVFTSGPYPHVTLVTTHSGPA